MLSKYRRLLLSKNCFHKTGVSPICGPVCVNVDVMKQCPVLMEIFKCVFLQLRNGPAGSREVSDLVISKSSVVRKHLLLIMPCCRTSFTFPEPEYNFESQHVTPPHCSSVIRDVLNDRFHGLWTGK